MNKKVLLREHKRHTDRGASSTPSVTRGGVPPCRGTPRPGLMGGTQGGVPPGQVGYPRLDLAWVPPQPDLDGVPPPPAGPGRGTPSPTGVDWQTKWNYNLPSRTTYAVGNNMKRGYLESNLSKLTNKSEFLFNKNTREN